MKKFHFSVVDSTNSEAKRLLEHFDNVMVSADFQISGRGRNGKIWHGQQNCNVYCSFGLRLNPPKKSGKSLHYQQLGALISIEALRRFAPDILFVLKYPNDIYAQDNNARFAKISGVLVEQEFYGMACHSVAIGIGINVEQREFPDNLNATSLALLGKSAKSSEILSILEDLANNFLYLTPENVVRRWKEELGVVGKAVSIVGNSEEWRAEQFTEEGFLIVKNIATNEEYALHNGDSLLYELG